jgi:hypothetical protein
MKKKDPTDTNILDDLFWNFMPERKEREPSSDESMDEDELYLKQLEDRKRARREALQKKYQD